MVILKCFNDAAFLALKKKKKIENFGTWGDIKLFFVFLFLLIKPASYYIVVS